MNRRRAAALLAITLALFAALHLLVYGLYRSAARTVDEALRDRLDALGRTAARALPLASADEEASRALLRGLVDENRLEDAYVVSAGLRLLAGARAAPGAPVNLMRLDPRRLTGAFAGEVSIIWGYAVGDTAIESGFFPLPPGVGQARVLVLEAGGLFRAPAARLRFVYGVAAGISVLLTGIFAAALLLVIRSLERARLAYGRAERLAAVGQMAAMVAHEVRNPLGILRAQAELLRESNKGRLPEGSDERVTDMLSEIERIRRLTDEFLTLSRDTPLDRAPCDLRPLLHELAADVALAPEGAQARIDVQVPPTLQVSADAAKLKQLLLNLLMNAIAIKPDVTVSVRASLRRREVVLQVADDGPGVEPALRGNLFQPFVTGRRGGSGLGLAVARRIAELHGGTLVLEPPEGGHPGAVFTLRWPAADTGRPKGERWHVS